MSRVVYLIEGWFGSDEWVEGVWEKEADANEACEQLWSKRVSDHAPDYVNDRALCKFAVTEWALQ